MPNEECVVTTSHMFSVFDTHTYMIGCKHRSLAIVTFNWRDQHFEVALLLEHKTVCWRVSHEHVTITESTEVG